VKAPDNSKFERMRADGERKRLAEIEARSTALVQQLDDQSAETMRREQTLRDESARLAQIAATLQSALENGSSDTRQHLDALRERLDGLSDRVARVESSIPRMS